MSRLAGAAVLALLLGINLLVSAPARLLGLLVPPEQLVLQGLTGTLWQGSASSVLLRLPQGYFQLGTVQWSLKPLSLLLLAPHLTLASQWGNQTVAGELVLRGQQDLDVLDLEGQVPATLLSQFAPVALEGVFTVQLQQLQLRDGLPYSGEGRLVFQDGGWQSPRGLVQLGSYALDFQQAAGEAWRGKVLTLAGPLLADGFVQLKGRRYTVDIMLRSDESLDEQLQNMLSLIALPKDGGFRINMDADF